jgi:hypothetical protein
MLHHPKYLYTSQNRKQKCTADLVDILIWMFIKNVPRFQVNDCEINTGCYPRSKITNVDACQMHAI